MNQNPHVQMNCDGIARYYEMLEHISFGKRLEQTRFAFLGETRASQRAILCGGGDGRFLARLLRENPRVQVDYVDLSPKMAELAERRVASMGRAFRERVRFRVGDVREFEPHPGSYDLIVTHFFLDCFSEPELGELLGGLARCATPDARWIVSEFCEAEWPAGRIWSRAVIRALYAVFALTTGLKVARLPNYADALARAGYILRCEEKQFGGLLYSSLWEAGKLFAGARSMSPAFDTLQCSGRSTSLRRGAFLAVEVKTPPNQLFIVSMNHVPGTPSNMIRVGIPDEPSRHVPLL
jgi:ubiquinone/menaquinone biosynthesis C-methylase UbiE